MSEIVPGAPAPGIDFPPPPSRAAGGLALPSWTQGEWRARPGTALAVRTAVVLGAIVVAYHYSLLTLLRGLTLEIPLAYLGLVPVLALMVAVVHSVRWRMEPDIHDRYVDYIIGIPLLIVALVIVLIVPIQLSTFYWRWRLDIASLPIFVAAAVTLVFGLRTTWRLRIPIAFLFLAWPLPYTLVIDSVTQAFTTATVVALQRIVELVPVATSLPGGDGSLFLLPYGEQGFVVSVAAACAGVNGGLGFLLVGGAFTAMLRGGVRRKLAWLLIGVTVTWLMNVGRILTIFVAGGQWGEAFAIDSLHPVIGLVTFSVGVLAMVFALTLFGLRIGAPSERPGAEPLRSLRLRLPIPLKLGVRRPLTAAIIVLIAGTVAAGANMQLPAYERIAHDLGPSRIGAWSLPQAIVTGWSAAQTANYDWSRRYFGADSGWNRYTYLSTSNSISPAAPTYVTLDVISTSDLGTFSTYGLEACYDFHNYDTLDSRRVDLGAGVVGRSIVYYNPTTKANWTAVYWEWPVVVGGTERYERVILNMISASEASLPLVPASSGPFAALQLAIAAALGSSAGELTDPAFLRTRDFLVGFGREIVIARSDPNARLGAAAAPGP